MGEPANVPRASATAPEYLAVHDMPEQRSQRILDSAQQEKIQNELVNARNRQSKMATSDAADVRDSQASVERLTKAGKRARSSESN